MARAPLRVNGVCILDHSEVEDLVRKAVIIFSHTGGKGWFMRKRFAGHTIPVSREDLLEYIHST